MEATIRRTADGRGITAKALAFALCALVASLPPALSLLHAETPSDTIHVEAEHEPGSCHYLHDHDVCRAFGANPPTPSTDGPRLAMAAPRTPLPVASPRRRPPAAGETSTRHPRAPPRRA